MLSRDANIVGGRVKTVDTKDSSLGTGTKEEEDRLKQMKINMETARRQGDQDTVKEIKEAIEELEASIKHDTVFDTKDDQSDADRVKIEHLKEAIKQYPNDPKNEDRKREIKELEAKITKGTSDAGLLTCKYCKSTFAADHVRSHMKKFNKDKSFMTTKHCPNCDKRISLKDENPDVEAAKKRIVLLNRYGAQCRMGGEREEYEKALKEIKELDDLIANIRMF